MALAPELLKKEKKGPCRLFSGYYFLIWSELFLAKLYMFKFHVLNKSVSWLGFCLGLAIECIRGHAFFFLFWYLKKVSDKFEGGEV